jgi:hypothetical protein
MNEILNQGTLTEGGRIGMIDLLVLTSLDQLLFRLKIFFSFLTKQANSMRRSTVLSLSLQLVFPDRTNNTVYLNKRQKYKQTFEPNFVSLQNGNISWL